MSRRPWSCAQRLRLLRLAGTLSEPALAERFGRSVPAIHAALWKLRGRQTPVTSVPPVPPVDPKAAAAAARALAAEIAAARAERATAPLYRPGALTWR